MKMLALLASVLVVSSAHSQMAGGYSSKGQSGATEIHQVPSIDAARAMIEGQWSSMFGRNPSTMKITRDTIWDSLCWSRFKLLGSRTGRANKTDAYVVELEFLAEGGPGECGQGNQPYFGIALIPVDGVVAGKATGIYWLICSSKRDFQVALRDPDPRDSNVMCSTYASARDDHR
jgi:hypothetical protein